MINAAAAPTTTLTVGDGAPAFPLAPTVYRNDLNRAVDEFTLNATGGDVTVTSIVLRATSGASNVGSGCVHLFYDTNGNHQWDAGDVIITDTAFVGTDATFNLSGSPIVITSGSTQSFIVTYDIAPTAVPAQTINGSVLSVASNAGTTTNNDNTDATMTVGTMVLTVTDAPNPASKSAAQGSTNNAVAKFTLATNAGTASVSQIVITSSANPAFVQAAGVNLWVDVNGDNEWDAGDTLVAGNVSFAGATATFDAPPIDATTTPVGYIVTYDITPGATVGQTTNGYISSITSDANTNTNNDNTVDATLTISAGACVPSDPAVSITPSTGSTTPGNPIAYDVTVTNNDSSFCGNTTFSLAVINAPAVPNANFSGSSLTASSTGPLAPQGIWTTTLTHTATAGATIGATEMSYVTVSGAGHASVQSNTATTTIVASWSNNSMLHNSTNLASTAWSPNGWGIPSGKYGAFVCTTCHTRSTTNIKRIKTQISSENSDTWPNGSTTTNTISFTQANGTNSDMGKAGTINNSGVCNVCHSGSYHTFYYYNGPVTATHQPNDDCTICHKHNSAFSGDGPCMSCHNAAQTGPYGGVRQVVGGAAGSPGDDFIRLSRHVSNGTNTSIVTNYDCVICHAEGDASRVAAGTGWLDKTKHKQGVVKLRNVDTITTSYDWNKTAPTTAMRDNMDTFCMSCHDSNGASGISVNNTNPASGLFLNDTATVRSIVGANNANPNNVTVNLRPFNTSDNLRNGRDATWTAGTTTNLGTFRTSTYGRVLNVKDQFNSTNQVGKAWASHHNLNQFTKRYSTRNTTAWPAATWTTYVTKEGVTINSATGGEIAGLHCSDCHLNETNAHGSRNAWYMNQSKDTAAYAPGSEPDTTPTVSGAANNATQRMCFRCHNGAVYGADTTTGTNARYDHSTDCAGSSVGTHTATQVFGATCFACHGGTSTNTDPAGTATPQRRGLGAIHGTNETYNPGNGATASKRYRFMSGGSMRFYNPNGSTAYTAETQWQAAGLAGCYTVATATRDVFGGCTSHGSTGRTEVQNRARNLEY